MLTLPKETTSKTGCLLVCLFLINFSPVRMEFKEISDLHGITVALLVYMHLKPRERRTFKKNDRKA